MQHSLEIESIRSSLLYLHCAELKAICQQLQLLSTGVKIVLVQRILHFFKTGQELKTPQYPSISKAKKGADTYLSPQSLILKGLYKKDLKTRLFFKSLIGKHFHFTAFGIDWINNQWLQGSPPTYQQFADFWVSEVEFRKTHGLEPKEEWAYIRFAQAHSDQYPTRAELLQEWDRARNEHVMAVQQVVNSYQQGEKF